MRVRFYLVLSVLAIAHCQAQPVDQHRREKELALGAQIAAELRQRVTVIALPSVDEYLRRIGSYLVAPLKDAAPACMFAVIAEDTSGGLHEPITLPGCYIFVPAKLFTEARNEAEFAGMLAQAIAHSAVDHRSARPLYATLAGDAKLIPDGALNGQRAVEREADTVAVQTAKASYNPAGLVAYIERVQPAMVGAPAGSALPDRNERVAAIEGMIQRLPEATYSSGEQFATVQQEVQRAAAK